MKTVDNFLQFAMALAQSVNISMLCFGVKQNTDTATFLQFTL